MLKLDFRNAFNSVHRNVILQTVYDELPGLYSFVYSCYFKSSFLQFGDFTLFSSEGVQQGDPLGPLLYSLASFKLARGVSCELNIWYLDDGSIGGDVDTLLQDFDYIKREGPNIGLFLNEGKCEIITDDITVVDRFRQIAPSIIHTRCKDALLLGAPVGNYEAVTTVLQTKLSQFKCLTERLVNFNAHDAFFLLRNCFALPKLLYTLRSAPCFSHDLLKQYDDVIFNTMQSILNINLSANAPAWEQATLPVSAGGLGTRTASDIALPAFLSSVAGTDALIKQLLPPRLHDVSGTNDSAFRDAIHAWFVSTQCTEAPQSVRQSAWDGPLVRLKAAGLLLAAQSQSDRARLLAASAPHAGDFLIAIPCSPVGTRMDPDTLRIAVALRLGLPLCNEYKCICGSVADTHGSHALTCHKTNGRHLRHNAVNDLIKRALASAEIPSRLEPSFLSRDDGKRPDGITLMPWANGKCLVWDFTCSHTLAASFLNRAVLGQGTVACDAERRKLTKYTCLSTNYTFVPVAIETIGALGSEALMFFTEIGHRVRAQTHEQRSFNFLMQRLSVAVQRGNAACVFGTVPPTARWDDLFYI
jgi:hypothetical protein